MFYILGEDGFWDTQEKSSKHKFCSEKENTLTVWLTRSSELWIDGKSGLFLEPLQTRHPLSRRAHVQERTDKHCDVNYRNWDSLLML